MLSFVIPFYKDSKRYDKNIYNICYIIFFFALTYMRKVLSITRNSEVEVHEGGLSTIRVLFKPICGRR